MITKNLNLVLAGPLLRRVEKSRLCFWLAVSKPVAVRLNLECSNEISAEYIINADSNDCTLIAAGDYLFYLFIDLKLNEILPTGKLIEYTLSLKTQDEKDGNWLSHHDWAPDICYPNKQAPCFQLPEKIDALLHGSCRKPHHWEGDGLSEADKLLASTLSGDVNDPDPPGWPDLLVLSGDQIYADDVAGPMLWAIHQLIQKLGMPCEKLPGLKHGLNDTEVLYKHRHSFYEREQLLPRYGHNRALLDIFFGGVEKPIFTSDTAHNHLISLSETLVMYLLVWSPAAWDGISLEQPSHMNESHNKRYDEECGAINEFISHLSAVRRVLAHLPTAMIFDDHDVSDDWNLSREWEEVAYEEPFSRRVIGNALIGYFINQGWGNDPDAFSKELIGEIAASLMSPGSKRHGNGIERLLRFEQWHYQWPTSPPLVVVDTRTRRWRSEVAASQPSGLLDWEGLTDLQHTLRDLDSVVLVSPAPIFGVKLIEVIQRIFTWFGKPLLVDAENWMAHPGSAHAILNIFLHRKTPRHFVILSGDVHYSFVYDIELRKQDGGPKIWQICSSGTRNEFPPKLLSLLDHMNRWLYSPRSVLNWFTRRRRMRITPRKPEGTPHGRRLLNGSSIGLVELDTAGVPWRIRELTHSSGWVTFTRREEESRWR